MLDAFLSRFETISLEQMDSVKLMNRVDTKYVTTREKLEGLLEDAIGDGYLVLETPQGGRKTEYDSVYLDTDERLMYLLHQARRLVRTKVRTRTYVSSGETFIEVKRKNNHGRTKKKRVRIAGADSWRDAADFIAQKAGYDASTLSPALRTCFTRITLVNQALTERVTMDFDLSFSDLRGTGNASLGNVVIIELKQDGLKPSQMRRILLDRRIHPMRMSKYCIGTAMTVPGIKKNNLIVKLRTISKLT